ncbi:MAG: hypothetical protein V4735_01835 [Pseudomonadota bacterium]
MFIARPSPPIIVVAPVAEPVTPAAPPAAPIADPNDSSTQILELFNPSDQYLTNQLSDTVITQQIEQIFTLSFVLTKCHRITADDYRDSFRALIVYAQQMKLAPDGVSAEARVRKIAESAGASYALVYSRTNCADPDLPIRAQQLLKWQTAILDNH